MTDFKQELKTASVEKWAQSELSVPAYIARNEEITTANPGTFSNWIKDYINNVNATLKDLRQTKNDLQKIIDNQAEALHKNSAYELILAENLIYSVQDLKNHFSCVSAADDVKQIERLKEIESILEEFKKSNCCIFASTTGKWNLEYTDLDNMLFTTISTGWDFFETLKRGSEKDWKPVTTDEDKSYSTTFTEIDNENKLLKAENERLKVDVSNLNCIIDDKEDAQFEHPVVTLATLQDYCQAVVDADKALRRFLEGN